LALISNISSLVLYDFRRAWSQLIITDLIYKVIAFALLTPLVGFSLRLFISTSGKAVLADQDILFFLLSPVGLVALVVISSIILGMMALEQACLMAIGGALTQNARIGVLEILWSSTRHAGSILHLMIRIVTRVLFIAAPFLAAAGLVYLTLLTRFDINYYLTEKPPAFWLAACIIIVLLSTMTILIIRRLIRWVFALPLYLCENLDVSEALLRSQEKTKGYRGKIFLMLAVWAVVSLLLSALTVGITGLMGHLILPSLTSSMKLLLLGMGGLFIFWSGTNLLISIFATSSFALLVVRLYDRWGKSDQTGPVGLERNPSSPAVRKWNLSLGKLLAGILIFAGGVVWIGIFLIDGIRLDDDILIMAHRGAAGVAPENTLASIERAIADQADFVEIDVQETADDEVVVIHDSDLMRVGGTNLKIWDASYDQLQDIDIGSWFSPEFSEERVPRLAQVLSLCKGRARVNIELKYYGHDKHLEERVIEIVEAADMTSQIVLMSLKYSALEKMRTRRPDWTLGLLTAKAVGNLATLDADFLAVHTGLVNRRFIRSAHENGKKVFVWTVNDALLMSEMISLGVDGLITDEPALARSVLKERADMNPLERLLLSFSMRMGVQVNQQGPETDL